MPPSTTLNSLNPVESILHIRAANFSIENNAKTQANVLFKENILTYCIIGQDKEVQVLRSFKFDKKNLETHLEQFIQQDDILQRFVGNVNIAFNDNQHSLIPKEFFESKELEAYYPTENFNPETDKLLYDFIEPIGYYNVFAIPQTVYDYLHFHYPQAEFHCAFSCLLSNILTESVTINQDRVITHIGKNLMEVFIIKNQQLTFHNCFDYQTPEDFLYHLLNATYIEKIDLEQNPVYFTGQVYKTGSLFQLASQYIPNIKFGIRPTKYHYNQALKAHPSHLHYNLFSI